MHWYVIEPHCSYSWQLRYLHEECSLASFPGSASAFVAGKLGQGLGMRNEGSVHICMCL